jgi:hypothetical protein
MEIDLSCWVVRKNRQYLVAIPEMLGAKPKYSPYAYDAARIKDANKARAVADKVGGNIHRFYPLTGDVI